MNPYGPEHWILYVIVEYACTALIFLFILLPFLLLRLKWFRPTRWFHIAGAYLVSFPIPFIILEIADRTDKFLYENASWLWGPFDDAYLKMGWFIFIWPLMIFYSTKLQYGKFTKENVYASIAIALIMCFVLFILTIVWVASGIGAAFSQLAYN